MGTWWQGTALVAERGLVENIRSRSFKVVTGLLLLLSVAAVLIPQILNEKKNDVHARHRRKGPRRGDSGAGRGREGSRVHRQVRVPRRRGRRSASRARR
jgi:hypothetical protein